MGNVISMKSYFKEETEVEGEPSYLSQGEIDQLLDEALRHLHNIRGWVAEQNYMVTDAYFSSVRTFLEQGLEDRELTEA